MIAKQNSALFAVTRAGQLTGGGNLPHELRGFYSLLRESGSLTSRGCVASASARVSFYSLSCERVTDNPGIFADPPPSLFAVTRERVTDVPGDWSKDIPDWLLFAVTRERVTDTCCLTHTVWVGGFLFAVTREWVTDAHD